MKIEITMPDASGHNVGDVVDVKGDTVPSWAVNKCRVIDKVEADKVAVTNPSKGAMPGAPKSK
jgi:beta-lactam-binding protein with PASTA domain